MAFKSVGANVIKSLLIKFVFGIAIVVMGRVIKLYSMAVVLGPALGTLMFELRTRRLGLNSVVLVYPILSAICLVVPAIVQRPSLELGRRGY